MKKKNAKKAKLLDQWAKNLNSKSLKIEADKERKKQDKAYYRGNK